jgi:hypothetical protein
MPGFVNHFQEGKLQMNASKFVAVATLAALAAVVSVGARADEADASQFAVKFDGKRTRAEVNAEAVTVAKTRSQEPAGSRFVAVKSEATRADVRAQAAQAVRTGNIPSGEAEYL